MIEVNLLPGGRKRASKMPGLPSISLPSIGGLEGLQDRWILGAVAMVIVAGLGGAWMWTTSSAAEEEVTVALEEARRDSTRFADVIARTELLQSRRDSIAQRAEVIQEIDQGRYIWAHVLDEVARALPDYTWLTQLVFVSDLGNGVRMRLRGQAGNNLALAVFMEQLEASEFLRNVDFISTEAGVSQGQVVYAFELEMDYRQPPLEDLETVPLFGADAPPVPEAPDDATQASTGPGS